MKYGSLRIYKRGKKFEDGTNRLGNLIEKHKCFRDLILIPEILSAAYEVIKSDIKVAGFNLRNPLKMPPRLHNFEKTAPAGTKMEPKGCPNARTCNQMVSQSRPGSPKWNPRGAQERPKCINKAIKN